MNNQVTLKPITYSDIAMYAADFKKRSNTCESIPANAELLGVFVANELAGYFIVREYQNETLEINQAYLNNKFRHKHISALAIAELEKRAKAVGYKRIILASSRTLKAYTLFMANMGYKPERIIFSKQVGN